MPGRAKRAGQSMRNTGAPPGRRPRSTAQPKDCAPTVTRSFCSPGTARAAHASRSTLAYAGVNRRTSWPAAHRVLVSAPATSARPPVLDSGATSEASMHTASRFSGLMSWRAGARGYDDRMQRFLIALALILLLAVSIGVGVAVARWPHLWH